MGLRQVEQGFSSFFARFLAYLMIFQSLAVLLMLHFVKSSNMPKNLAQNEEKALFNLP